MDATTNFTFRLYAGIHFNRKVDPKKDYVSPGGYEMVTKCGKVITFDFEDYEGGVNPDNRYQVEVMQKNPDYITFDDLNSVTEDDLKNIVEIREFYVYTGEDGETDLEPDGLDYFGFEIIPMSGEIYDIDYTKKFCPLALPIR